MWVGYDNSEQSLHEYGAQAALPIWMQFMKNALVGQPLATMQQPPNIVSERIDVKTGLVAPANVKNVMFEVFDKNALPLQATGDESTDSSSPTSSSDVYHGSDGVTDSNIF